MTDTVSIIGIRAHGYHGVLDFERANGQDFVVDVEMTVDVLPAAHSDDLTLTVDYGEVTGEVVTLITGPPVSLIETLAEQIAQRVRMFPGVQQVTVAVHKPDAPIPHPFDDVVVRITR